MICISDRSPADILREQDHLRVEISGHSMQPLLKEGRNTVHIQYLTQAPERLDVVLFRRNDGAFVLHRIISVCGDSYTLCGDHQTIPESGITRQQIIGRMEGYYTGEHYHTCSGFFYRLYACLWTRSMPLRKFWYAMARRLRGDKP